MTQNNTGEDRNREWMRVGATIADIRKIRGFTADELANKIPISRTYLSNIEAGRRPLPQSQLARFAEVLAVRQIAILYPEDFPVDASATP